MPGEQPKTILPIEARATEMMVSPIAIRIKFFHDAWKQITSDKFFLGITKGYKIKFNNEPNQKFPAKEPVMSNTKKYKFKIAIEALEEKDEIFKCKPCIK